MALRVDSPQSQGNSIVCNHLPNKITRNLQLFRWAHDEEMVQARIHSVANERNDT